MSTVDPSQTHIRWPADRFYWSVLEAPGWKRCGPLPAALQAAFEDEIPEPIDRVHAVCAPMATAAGGSEARVIVCAVRLDDIATIPGDSIRLTPDSVPAALGAAIDPDLLNLLIGRLEPAHHRRARIRRHLAAAACLLIAVALVVAGAWRRAAHWDRLASSADAAAASLLPEALDHDLVAAQARLDAAIQRAHSLELLTARDERPPDASLVLADLLKVWPAKEPAKPQSVGISPDRIAASLVIDGSATPFLAAFTPPTGWTLEPPRLNTVDQVTRLSLVMHRSAGPSATPSHHGGSTR